MKNWSEARGRAIGRYRLHEVRYNNKTLRGRQLCNTRKRSRRDHTSGSNEVRLTAILADAVRTVKNNDARDDITSLRSDLGRGPNDVDHRKLGRARTAPSTSQSVGRQLRQRPWSELRGSPAPANNRPSRASRLLASESTPRGDILALQPVHRCQDLARTRRRSASEASICSRLYV